MGNMNTDMLKYFYQKMVPASAGAHNALYRGKDLTDLFYDGTLSTEIAAGTFDDIFPGDYIIGKNSGRKYLVADLNYFLHCGDTECTTPHVVVFPELSMGTAQMNSSNITTGGYVGSEMYTTNLADFKTIIQNDFTVDHILAYRDYLTNAVTSGYPSSGAWTDCDIELMSESMVYGSKLRSPMSAYNGSSITVVENGTVSKSQLAIFRLDKSKMVAFNDSGSRQNWWLRDVVSSLDFAYVSRSGYCGSYGASDSYGVRPAFPII